MNPAPSAGQLPGIVRWMSQRRSEPFGLARGENRRELTLIRTGREAVEQPDRTLVRTRPIRSRLAHVDRARFGDRLVAGRIRDADRHGVRAGLELPRKQREDDGTKLALEVDDLSRGLSVDEQLGRVQLVVVDGSRDDRVEQMHGMTVDRILHVHLWRRRIRIRRALRKEQRLKHETRRGRSPALALVADDQTLPAGRQLDRAHPGSSPTPTRR